MHEPRGGQLAQSHAHAYAPYDAVLMPADECAAWQETAYLFRSPANARRLLDAYERATAGRAEAHELGRADDAAEDD